MRERESTGWTRAAIARAGRRPCWFALALLVAVPIGLGACASASETPSTRSSIPPESPSPSPSSEVTAREVFAGIHDPTLSNPERSQFLRGFHGASVRWEGRFSSLQRVVRTRPDRVLWVVLFMPNLGAETEATDVVLASFPSSAEGDLASLTPGDRIVVSCRLVTTGPRSFSLRDCELEAARKAEPPR